MIIGKIMIVIHNSLILTTRNKGKYSFYSIEINTLQNLGRSDAFKIMSRKKAQLDHQRLQMIFGIL